jgi:hypothetical protein
MRAKFVSLRLVAGHSYWALRIHGIPRDEVREILYGHLVRYFRLKEDALNFCHNNLNGYPIREYKPKPKAKFTPLIHSRTFPSDHKAACVPNTLANMLGVSYEEANRMCHETGARPDNVSGTYTHKFLSYDRKTVTVLFGKKLRMAVYAGSRLSPEGEYMIGTARSRYTVKQFLADHPKGEFLVMNNKHMWGVWDGYVVDSLAMRESTTVKLAWRVVD